MFDKKEYMKIYNKQYYKNNCKKEIDRHIQWQKDNSKKVNKNNRQWQKNNPGKIKKWRKRNIPFYAVFIVVIFSLIFSLFLWKLQEFS